MVSIAPTVSESRQSQRPRQIGAMKVRRSDSPAPGPVHRPWSETGDPLFGQRDLVFDMKVPGGSWRSRTRLASTDADGVIPGGDDGAAKLGDHAQVADLQLKVKLLACAWFE